MSTAKRPPRRPAVPRASARARKHRSAPGEIAPAALIPRIPATEIFPVVEDGLWAPKACVQEYFPVRATVFREGHDALGAEVVLLRPDGKVHQRATMYDIAPGLDRLEAWVAANKPGDWAFRIDTWSDPYTTWTHDAAVKIAADVDVELVFAEGVTLLERAQAGEALGAARPTPLPEKARKILAEAAAILQDRQFSAQHRLSAGLSSRVRAVFRQYPLRDLASSSRTYPIRIDRIRALYGSWYEIFPRSLGATCEDGEWTSGTLRTAAAALPRIADLGFDVIYLTPIHPIGHTYRKGRNNTLTAEPGDPGSPYGIGAGAGGHDAIHPDLGTFADFAAFVQQARGLGMEVALDIALQCSPDHPWVQEHPEWFTKRADGSIAYAENPPKKYQDIYPLNFDNDPEGIYQGVRDVLEIWVAHGVTLFRVDNPHTKPLQFWQRLLAEFREKHPDVIFLAEAFTRPAMMRTLGAIGFHQSYTYFTWRNTKKELESYLLELAEETAHLMRPAFWPTTHDILTPFMTEGGAPAFALRAVLAATGSPTWGIYSGYELVESEPRPGAEEQIDNEKYEYRPRDWSAGDDLGIAALLGMLNSTRRRHPALHRLRNVTIHPTTNDQLICYSRHLTAAQSPTGEPDTVIVVVNLDPHHTQIGEVQLDLAALELSSGHPVVVRDELDGREYSWGAQNYVELNPKVRSAHVLAVVRDS